MKNLITIDVNKPRSAPGKDSTPKVAMWLANSDPEVDDPTELRMLKCIKGRLKEKNQPRLTYRVLNIYIIALDIVLCRYI